MACDESLTNEVGSSMTWASMVIVACPSVTLIVKPYFPRDFCLLLRAFSTSYGS